MNTPRSFSKVGKKDKTMKTKQQKAKEIEQGKNLLEDAKSLVFVNFSNTPVKDITILKRLLDDSDSTYKVLKKRLLGLALKEKNIPVDINQFDSQLATIFSKKDISEPSGTVYKFSKGKEKEIPGFKMVGGFDLVGSKFFGADEIKKIGSLPSKEILITQFLYMLNTPARSLAFVLSEIAKTKS